MLYGRTRPSCEGIGVTTADIASGPGDNCVFTMAFELRHDPTSPPPCARMTRSQAESGPLAPRCPVPCVLRPPQPGRQPCEPGGGKSLGFAPNLLPPYSEPPRDSAWSPASASPPSLPASVPVPQVDSPHGSQGDLLNT